MTARRTHGYNDTWDAFIDGILCPGLELAALGKLERLTQQLHWDQKIAMIVALSKDWTAREHRESGEARKQQKAAAAAELARLTPLPGAFVDYVNDETKRLLPVPGVIRRDRQTRRMSMDHASEYFRRLDQSPNRRIEWIIRLDLRFSSQQWACAHPYGPRVSPADLSRYRDNQVRPWQLRKKMAFNPAGMTPERALQIAMRVLG